MVLSSGIFTAQTDLHLADLVLVNGAVLDTPIGQTLKLTVDDAVQVQTGTVVSVSGRGYAGGSSTHPSGYALDLVTGSSFDAGGSHGGTGSTGNNPGLAGEVYDSVYQPILGGGGGSKDQDSSASAGFAGGGTLVVEATELVLEGAVLARGAEGGNTSNGPAGAGGSVLVRAGTVRGGGQIDASGGGSPQCNGGLVRGLGGGGRVALYVGAFDGFDLGLQVKAWGGIRSGCGSIQSYAAPGTVLVLTEGDVHGRLTVDQGLASGPTVPTTSLTSIGSGIVGTVEPDPVDAASSWIEPLDPNQVFGVGVVGM